MKILTSEQALRLDRLPSSAIVLGGGVIGVEFASAWRSFGVNVTIVEALPRLVSGEDSSVSAALERAFRTPPSWSPDRRRRGARQLSPAYGWS